MLFAYNNQVDFSFNKTVSKSIFHPAIFLLLSFFLRKDCTNALKIVVYRLFRFTHRYFRGIFQGNWI